MLESIDHLAQALIRERLAGLAAKPFEELGRLPECNSGVVRVNGKQFTVTIWRDTIGSGGCRIVVQVHRNRLLGVCGYMWADGFIVTGENERRTLTDEERYPFRRWKTAHDPTAHNLMTGKRCNISHFSIRVVILLVFSPLFSCQDTETRSDPRTIRQAKALLHEARDIALDLDDSAESSVSISRAWALTHIAILQAEIADCPGAFATVKMVKTDFAKDYALASISATQAARGDVAGASRTIAHVQEGVLRRSALENILAAQVRAGDVEEAVSTRSLLRI